MARPGGRSATATSVPAEGDPALRAAGSRRSAGGRLPALTWAGSFVVLTTLLLARNAYLFTTRIYEDGDFAANTIAVLQARHFMLLTGNYSVEGFYHPGPAFLYLAAGGESFFYDVLHLVPTPWNGQVLAILLLNAAALAACVAVIARHAGSPVAALACLTLVLVFAALHPLAFSSPWLPYAYVAPTLLLLVSAASVGAGRTEHLPLLAGSALACINGHAEFLLFAPVTVAVSVAGLIVTRRRSPAQATAPAWHWALALGVAAALALPIIVNTAVHWPGVFGAYLRFARDASGTGTSHSLLATVTYTLRFWWLGHPDGVSALFGLCVAAVLSILALAAALRCPQPGLRRFLLWSLGLVVLTTVLFVGYAYEAINDSPGSAYIGYFYWTVPLLTALTAVAGAAAWAGRRASTPAERRTARGVIGTPAERRTARGVIGTPAERRTARGVIGTPAERRTARGVIGTVTLGVVAVAAGIVAGLVPVRADAPSSPGQYAGDPGIPRDVHALAAAARGRPIVLTITDNSWVTTVGIIAYADRIGLRACLTDPYWALIFRSQSVCTPGEMRSGIRFTAGNIVRNGRPEPVPRGSRVVLTVPRTDTRITTAG